MKEEIREVIGFCCSERGLYPLAYELFLVYIQSRPESEEVVIEITSKLVHTFNWVLMNVTVMHTQ